MIEYRAVVQGVKTERPIQTVTNTLRDAESWADVMLRHHKDASLVEIHISEEKLLKTVRRKTTIGVVLSTPCASCGHEASHHLKTTHSNDSKFGNCRTCMCPQFKVEE